MLAGAALPAARGRAAGGRRSRPRGAAAGGRPRLPARLQRHHRAARPQQTGDRLQDDAVQGLSRCRAAQSLIVVGHCRNVVMVFWFERLYAVTLYC